MRQIKFRAWNPDDNKMEYPLVLAICNDGTLKPLIKCADGNRAYKDYPLMQFTGLKDANGKGNDVYEGDLFEAIYKDCPDGYSILGRKTTVIKVIAKVVFNFGQFAVEMMHPEYNELVYTNLHDFLKNEQKIVIGNVYEDPELLNP